MRFSRTLHLAELNFKSSSILVLRQISFITDLIDADLPAGGGTLPACCEMVQATPLLRRDWRKMPKHEPTSYESWDPVLDVSQKHDEREPFIGATQAPDSLERSGERLEWELTRWPEGAEL